MPRVTRIEPAAFGAAYQAHGGRLVAVAQALGISYSTARRYRRRWGWPAQRHGWPAEAAVRSAMRRQAGLPAPFRRAGPSEWQAMVERQGSVTAAAAAYGVSRTLLRRALGGGWTCRV